MRPTTSPTLEKGINLRRVSAAASDLNLTMDDDGATAARDRATKQKNIRLESPRENQYTKLHNLPFPLKMLLRATAEIERSNDAIVRKSGKSLPKCFSALPLHFYVIPFARLKNDGLRERRPAIGCHSSHQGWEK